MAQLEVEDCARTSSELIWAPFHTIHILKYIIISERELVSVENIGPSDTIIALKNVVLAKWAGCIHPQPLHNARRMEMMVAGK